MKKKNKGYYLSTLLRHKPELENLEYDEYGWFNVKDILERLEMIKSELDYIVDNNNKKRFRYNEDHTKIKASQGHSSSMKIKDDFKRVKNPPAYLFHGTNIKNKKSILIYGLLRMSRLHVHLSKDIETATKVGNRHVNDDKDLLILKIDAIELNKIHPIYISDNGVYLVKKVPSIFLL